MTNAAPRAGVYNTARFRLCRTSKPDGNAIVVPNQTAGNIKYSLFGRAMAARRCPCDRTTRIVSGEI